MRERVDARSLRARFCAGVRTTERFMRGKAPALPSARPESREPAGRGVRRGSLPARSPLAARPAAFSSAIEAAARCCGVAAGNV